MIDTDTINYYNENAEAYALSTRTIFPTDQLETFMTHLPAGSKVCDIGCGSGRDTIFLRKHGFVVTSIEPSIQLCKIVEARTGISPLCMTAQDINGIEEYEGMWACASLLHIPEEELPSVIDKIHGALKPNGVFYCSFKKGSGTVRDDNGRLQTKFTLSSLTNLTHKFKTIRAWITKDHTTGRCEWVNVICRKI